MNLKMFEMSPRLRAVGTLPLLVLLTCGGSVSAEPNYLAPGRPDGIALLPPPPAAGSREEAADLDTVRAVFKNRSAEEEARARRDATLAFSLFAPAIGSGFELAKLPNTEALLQKVKQDAGEVIDTPKNHWQRKRPYVLDPELLLGRPENSFSYPSGHSTRGTLYSLVLAELFPDRKEQILAIGCNIGWDRIIIGKHFLTDVFAGRVLGKAIFNQLMASAKFQRDLEQAKAEIQQVRAGLKKVREEAVLPMLQR